jgi:hypothetical protein
LKSIDIINYIDLLNEDAYSKFTVGQLYTKLGNDNFIKYVKGCCDTICRRNKVYFGGKMSFEETHNIEDFVSLEFENDLDKYIDGLRVNINLTAPVIHVDNYIKIPGRDTPFYGIRREISKINIDLYKSLETVVLNVYKVAALEKIRKELTTIETKDFSNFTLRQLFERLSIIGLENQLKKLATSMLNKNYVSLDKSKFYLNKIIPVVSNNSFYRSVEIIVIFKKKIKTPHLSEYKIDYLHEELEFKVFGRDEVPHGMSLSYKFWFGVKHGRFVIKTDKGNLFSSNANCVKSSTVLADQRLKSGLEKAYKEIQQSKGVMDTKQLYQDIVDKKATVVITL